MAFHTKQADASSQQEQAFSPKLADEDWAAVERLLPEQWQAKARELHALRRTRGVSGAAALLRVMLIHLAQGCGLRETAERARLGGIATLSDVAVLKRLRNCGSWFEWMGSQLRQQWTPAALKASQALRPCWSNYSHPSGGRHHG